MVRSDRRSYRFAFLLSYFSLFWTERVRTLLMVSSTEEGAAGLRKRPARLAHPWHRLLPALLPLPIQ